jgi:hypothetical protein
MKPQRSFEMPGVEGCRFTGDSDSIPYNQPLRLLAPDSPFPNGGRTFGPIFGAAIGQAITLLNTRNQRNKAAGKKAKLMAPDIPKQLSRSVLWRTFGDHQSAESWSGSPIEILEHDGPDRERQILGFQNYQWGKREANEYAAKTDEALKKETEKEAMFSAEIGYYPFYGCYNLPADIRRCRIVNQSLSTASITPVDSTLPDMYGDQDKDSEEDGRSIADVWDVVVRSTSSKPC